MADEGKVQLPLELDGMQLVAVCGRRAEKVQLPLDEKVQLHLDVTVQLADKVEKVQLPLELDGMQLVAVCGRKAEKVQLPLDETVLLADKVERCWR